MIVCPDYPCNETCPWCLGSGRITERVLEIYRMKKRTGSHDTDRELCASTEHEGTALGRGGV